MDAPKQFYRHQLPETCISFSSSEGIAIFNEALQAGHMSCYFKLAEQFRTQDEISFCGLSSLVMVLNSLSMDPGRVWKAPWRWYHESMLDCCIPLEMIKQSGLTFSQLVCLASCNGLDVSATQLTKSDDAPPEIDTFREMLKSVTQTDDSFLILNYFRPVLGQTGGAGHYSPVGGYNPGRDLLLILDTARFKYPPCWVAVSLVWESMMTTDQLTGERRGYFVMSRSKAHNRLVMFKISPSFSNFLAGTSKNKITDFISKWIKGTALGTASPRTPQNDCNKFPPSAVHQQMVETCSNHSVGTCCLIKKDVNKSNATDNAEDIVECAKYLLELLSEIPHGDYLLTTVVNLSGVFTESKEHASVVATLLDEIEATSVYKLIHDILKSESAQYAEAVKRLVNLDDLLGCCSDTEIPTLCSGGCELVQRVNHAHFIAMFLMAWPYRQDDDAALMPCMQRFGNVVGTTLNGELAILRKQIMLLLPR